MDKSIMDFNMSTYDRINRLVLGSMLLIAIMVATDSIPSWLALMPLYPILTAIIAWDPVYALFNLVRRLLADKTSFKGGKLALE